MPGILTVAASSLSIDPVALLATYPRPSGRAGTVPRGAPMEP